MLASTQDLRAAMECLEADVMAFVTRWLQVKIEEPIMRIPMLAIHLNRDIGTEGFKPNKQTHCVPVLATAIKKSMAGPAGEVGLGRHGTPLCPVAPRCALSWAASGEALLERSLSGTTCDPACCFCWWLGQPLHSARVQAALRQRELCPLPPPHACKDQCLGV